MIQVFAFVFYHLIIIKKKIKYSDFRDFLLFIKDLYKNWPILHSDVCTYNGVSAKSKHGGWYICCFKLSLKKHISQF